MPRPKAKKPNLSQFVSHVDGVRMPTEAEFTAAEKFTRIRGDVFDGWNDPHTVVMLVDGQQFDITGQYPTAKDASWRCWELARAIIKIQEAAI